jgi:hypothetical protein
LVPPGLGSPTPHTTGPSPPTEEETHHTDQEDRPPLPSATLQADWYAPPDCVQNPRPFHPHQFYIVRHEDHDSWRPIEEAHLPSSLEFVTQDELLAQPPAFPTVLAFKAHSHHTSLIAPTDLFQAGLFRIPTLITCSRAGLSPPTLDIPLGYIHFSYRASIKHVFTRLPNFARGCFSNALVISEIHDFLDGRRIFTYGFLHFDSGRIFIRNQGYHFEDAVRSHRLLLRYTLSPRLPLDPFAFLRVFRDEDPL